LWPPTRFDGLLDLEGRAYVGRMLPVTRRRRPHMRPNGLTFVRDDRWRPLRLVLDDETLSRDDIGLLLAFVDVPELELVRTAPNELPRFEPQAVQEDFVPIHQVTTSGVGIFGVWRAADLTAPARDIAEETAIEQGSVWRALVLSEASDEAEADGFVTRRDFLLNGRLEPGPANHTVEEALALIGLALRLHGNKTIGHDLFDLRLEGRTFHFVLARDLLRAGWRLPFAPGAERSMGLPHLPTRGLRGDSAPRRRAR
jgi:hypothetical protein